MYFLGVFHAKTNAPHHEHLDQFLLLELVGSVTEKNKVLTDTFLFIVIRV